MKSIPLSTNGDRHVSLGDVATFLGDEDVSVNGIAHFPRWPGFAAWPKISLASGG